MHSCIIAAQKEDGSFQSIHCKRLGMIPYSGLALLQSYTDIEKTDALMALGNLYILRGELGPRKKNSEENNCCVSLSRDNKKKNQEAKQCKTTIGLKRIAEEEGVDLLYIGYRKDGSIEWKVRFAESDFKHEKLLESIIMPEIRSMLNTLFTSYNHKNEEQKAIAICNFINDYMDNENMVDLFKDIVDFNTKELEE